MRRIHRALLSKVQGGADWEDCLAPLNDRFKITGLVSVWGISCNRSLVCEEILKIYWRSWSWVLIILKLVSKNGYDMVRISSSFIHWNQICPYQEYLRSHICIGPLCVSHIESGQTWQKSNDHFVYQTMTRRRLPPLHESSLFKGF